MSYHVYIVLNRHGRAWQDTLVVTMVVTSKLAYENNGHCVIVGYMAAANWLSTFMITPWVVTM